MMGQASGLVDQSIASGAVDETVDEIQEQANAELVLSSVGGTLTADGNVQVLYVDDEPLGCFKPLTLYVDLDEMIVGDTIVIYHNHRINDSPAILKATHYWTYTGVDGGLTNTKIAVMELTPNRHGFQVTLQQTGGVMRDYPWELFFEI